MFYVDTSLAVALFTVEPATEAALDWASRSAPLAVSAWVTVELRSAIATKARLGELGESARQEALRAYVEAARGELLTLPINEEVFREAAKFAGNVNIAVRGADALHLAIAAAHGATLATRDRPQAAAGASLGIRTLLL